jgi:hypothetical protein
LRISIEFVGGHERVLAPNELKAEEFTVRKAAGSVVELAGFLTMGLSPMWFFAAVADISGGSKIYLDALVLELIKNGLLPPDADIKTVDELLDRLEGASGQMAEMFDVPPLNGTDLRNSLRELKANAEYLPGPAHLASLFDQLQQVAKREERTLLSISALIAAGAASAGLKVGRSYVINYYQEAIDFIKDEGLESFTRRVSKPYLLVAGAHFDPNRLTYTGRLLRRLDRMKHRSK